MELEGKSVEEGYLNLFAVGAELKERFGNDFMKLPAGAMVLIPMLKGCAKDCNS